MTLDLFGRMFGYLVIFGVLGVLLTIYSVGAFLSQFLRTLKEGEK